MTEITKTTETTDTDSDTTISNSVNTGLGTVSKDMYSFINSKKKRFLKRNFINYL